MAHLIFDTTDAMMAFGSMAEGMEEAQKDNLLCFASDRADSPIADEIERAAALADARAAADGLGRLLAALAQSNDDTAPILIDDCDAALARAVIAECVKNSGPLDDEPFVASDATVIDDQTPDPVSVLRDLLEWAANTGGWDAPAWQRARECIMREDLR